MLLRHLVSTRRDGLVQPLSDGVQFVRFLAGFEDESFAFGESERDLYMDVDGDGTTRAFTDGMLIARFLAGFSGESLIAGAVSSTETRTDAESIVAWLSQFAVNETSRAPLPPEVTTTVVATSIDAKMTQQPSTCSN